MILGTDAEGSPGLGNKVGIQLQDSVGSVVGGASDADRNTISGNALIGVEVHDSSDTRIQANFVGATPDGRRSLPNGQFGLLVERAANLIIGLSNSLSIYHGPTAIQLQGISGSGSGSGGGPAGSLTHCYIGLNAAGDAPLGGTVDGLVVEDSSGFAVGGGSLSGTGGGPATRNVFAGISGKAMKIQRSSHIQVGANYVGTDRTGSISLPVGLGILAVQVRDLIIGTPETPSVYNGETAMRLQSVGGGGGGGSGSLVNCRIGINAAGTKPFGAMMDGVVLEDCSEFSIGSGGGGGGDSSEAAAARNIFAGIASTAMQFLRSTNIVVGANYVGTDVSGNISLPVGLGILAQHVRSLVIGTPVSPSVYNGETGIWLQSVGSGSGGGGGGGGSLVNCRIGLNAAGSEAFDTMIDGLILEDSSEFSIGFAGGIGPGGGDSSEAAAARNIFAGIQSYAMQFLRSTNILVGANYVGTDSTGATSLAVGTGIAAAHVRNLTIGTLRSASIYNGETAMYLQSVVGASGSGSGSASGGSSLVNCRIGLNAEGTEAFYNLIDGVVLEDCSGFTIGLGGGGGSGDSSDAAAARNIFAGIEASAMRFLRSTNIQVGANYVGTDVTGNTGLAVGVGIAAEQVRNLAIGSVAALSVFNASQVGVSLRRVGRTVASLDVNRLIHCYLGVHADGVSGFGGTAGGVQLQECEDVQLGEAGSGSGNVFGGLSTAVEIERSNRIKVHNSRIGTDASGTRPIRNLGVGVLISGTSHDVEIGGEKLREGNAIAHCALAGIRMAGNGDNVYFKANQIYGNLRPIERLLSGLHFPRITRAFRGSTHVEGTLNGQPGDTVRLEFFAHRPEVPTEGELYLGAINVTLNDLGAGAYNTVFPRSAPGGWRVASTASDSFAGTSEFSASLPISVAPDSDGDGLPDFWEARFPSCLNPFVPDPLNEDCDGDGFTNLQEYLANTDPTKPDSFLRVDTMTVSNLGAGNRVQVSFLAADGRQYGLDRSVDLNHWLRIVTVVPDAAGRVTLVDLNAPGGSAHYRIAAEFP